jgi:hypothetical protein
VVTPLGDAAMLRHGHGSCQANRARDPVSAIELHRIENRGNSQHEGKAYSTNIFVGVMEESSGRAKPN